MDLLQLLNLGVFAVSAFISYLLTFLFSEISKRLDLLDYPGDRKIHKRPTPFLGGLSVFTAFWTVVFAGVFISFGLRRGLPLSPVADGVANLTPKVIGIFFGSVLITLVGLLDDKFSWPPLAKLAGQSIAALILMNLGLTINLVSGLGPVGYVATFVWILLIMNAFNFIDSLDGHCTGIALISCVTFFAITEIIHQPLSGIFLIGFAGALLGFLPHNFKPARVFLGDNGSMFIGYMMAAFTLLCRYQTNGFDLPYSAVFIPILIFAVPIYDTISVIVVRLSRSVAPWKGDRNHFAHRLVKMGMSERVAVIFSYFVQLTMGLVALLTTQVVFFGAVLIGLLFLSIIGVIAFLEFYAAERVRVAGLLARRKKRRKEDIQKEMNGESTWT